MNPYTIFYENYFQLFGTVRTYCKPRLRFMVKLVNKFENGSFFEQSITDLILNR